MINPPDTGQNKGGPKMKMNYFYKFQSAMQSLIDSSYKYVYGPEWGIVIDGWNSPLVSHRTAEFFEGHGYKGVFNIENQKYQVVFLDSMVNFRIDHSYIKLIKWPASLDQLIPLDFQRFFPGFPTEERLWDALILDTCTGFESCKINAFEGGEFFEYDGFRPLFDPRPLAIKWADADDGKTVIFDICDMTPVSESINN